MKRKKIKAQGIGEEMSSEEEKRREKEIAWSEKGERKWKSKRKEKRSEIRTRRRE